VVERPVFLLAYLKLFYNMKKESVIYALVLICLTACRSNDNTVRFRVLNEGLEQYGKRLGFENQSIYDELEQKISDSRTKAKATIWQPKAVYVKKLSDSLRSYIDNLKSSVHVETRTLYHRIKDFNEKVLTVLDPGEFPDNPILQQDIQKVKEQFRHSFPLDITAAGGHTTDSTAGNMPNPIHDYFENADTLATLTMLNKLRNDISVAENRLISYCNSMTISYHEGFYHFFPLATISSSYLKPGQTLEINAGMGAFSSDAEPIVTINGEKIKLNSDGVALYRQTVHQKPGKYFIPVKIEFIQPSGDTARVSKKMEYRVAE